MDDAGMEVMHPGGEDGGPMAMDMPAMMATYFRTTVKENILFENCTTQTTGAMVGACVVASLVSFLFESLKYARHQIPLPASRKIAGDDSLGMVASTSSASKTEMESQRSQPGDTRLHSTKKQVLRHIVHTILYAFQVFVGYLLMLVVMTFNVWLLLAVGVGTAIGYFIFSSLPTVATAVMHIDNREKITSREKCSANNEESTP